jgi:hypothetical protein
MGISQRREQHGSTSYAGYTLKVNQTTALKVGKVLQATTMKRGSYGKRWKCGKRSNV